MHGSHRSPSFRAKVKTFLIWTWKALYQGSVIMLGGILLFETRVSNVVGITFTALILTELIMVAVEVKRWHPLMLLAQVLPPRALSTCRRLTVRHPVLPRL